MLEDEINQKHITLILQRLPNKRPAKTERMQMAILLKLRNLHPSLSAPLNPSLGITS